MKYKDLYRISIFIAIISFLGIYFPMNRYDPSSIPSDIVLVFRWSIIAFIFSSVMSVWFWVRSFSETDIDRVTKLVHWTYTEDEWEKFVLIDKISEEEHKKSTRISNAHYKIYLAAHKEKALFIFSSFVFLSCLAYIAILPEYPIEAFKISVIFEGIFILGYILLGTSGKISKNDKRPEVVVYTDRIYIGVKIGKKDVILKSMNGKLDSIVYIESAYPKYLEFNHSFTTRHGIVREKTIIPVPQYGEKDVHALLQKLKDFKPFEFRRSHYM